MMGEMKSWTSSTSPAAMAAEARVGPPMEMSRADPDLSLSIAAASKYRSIRVREVGASESVDE
jgi:hypothetical protein